MPTTHRCEQQNLAATLLHAENDCFSSGSTSGLSGPLVAQIRLVNLHVAREIVKLQSTHEFAYLLAHAPCCFVGNAKLPLQFLGGYAMR